MLWAKQLRDEHKILLKRIDAATQATAQIQPLVEQIKDLAASSEHLQAENNALKERILTLEEESAAKGEAMATEMGGLQRRINELEKELNCVVEDVNAWKDEWTRILDEGNVERNRRAGPKSPSCRNAELVYCAVNPVEEKTGKKSFSQTYTWSPPTFTLPKQRTCFDN